MKIQRNFLAILFLLALILWVPVQRFDAVTPPRLVDLKPIHSAQGNQPSHPGDGSTALPTSAFPGMTVVFAENFEGIDHPNDLFLPSLPPRWTGKHLTLPGNALEISTRSVHQGKRSARFRARGATRETVSGSSLFRNGFRFNPGDRVEVSAWFYIPSGQSIEDITLMNLECRHCWGEGNIYDNIHPGLRVQITGDAGTLEIDRRKIGYRGSNFKSGPAGKDIRVPRDRWFHLDWGVTLGLGEKGRTQLFLDGSEAVSGQGTNMANPDLFRDHYVVLKDTVMYDSVEFGVSSNPQPTDVELYLDDIQIGVESGH